MLWGATADGNCVGVIRLRGMMQLSDLRTKYRNLNTRKRKIVSTLAYDSKRSFWAMADQGVLSLGNFGVSILLAACFERKHDLSDFGAYWILMELMMFLNGIQNALVAYPLTVRGAIADRLQLGRLTSMSMLLTGVMWPLQAAAIVTTAAIAKIPMSVGIWAAIALFLWQMQETLRRGLMAHLKFRESLLGDSISYIGQLVAVALLGWYGMLTLTTAFQAIALTSGLAALVQGEQIAIIRTNDGLFAALSNFDPFSEAFVIARGIVGDRGGVPKIASPIYKQSFSLETGECMDDPNVHLAVYPIRVFGGKIQVALPAHPR